MKRIKLPEPIIIQEHKPATDKEPEIPGIKLDLLWFARHFLNGAKFFMSTGPGIRASTRIEDSIMGGVEVGYFDLHDEDHELMVQLTEEPGELGYPTILSNTKTGEPVPMAPRVIARFVNAFKFATDVAEETAEAAQ